MVTRLGPDGYVEAYIPTPSDCCPPDICEMSADAMSCAFVGYLPSGPIWDYWKKIASLGGDVECASLVKYAQFAGVRLASMLNDMLWPAIRESRVETAVTSLDDWLTRLNWIDCYGACRNRDITDLSPLEIMTPCGPLYCGIDYQDDYQIALNSAIARALSRMNMGIAGNLASINWVLEPLCAQVSPDPDDDTFLDCVCDHDRICLVLEPSCQTLRVPRENCDDEDGEVNAWIDNGCDRAAGLPQYVWPNILAAECIVRSLLPRNKLCIIARNCVEPESL